MIKNFKNEVENQFSKNIKVIRSDRRGKYGSPFNEFCFEHGLIHQTKALYTPQKMILLNVRTKHWKK